MIERCLSAQSWQQSARYAHFQEAASKSTKWTVLSSLILHSSFSFPCSRMSMSLSFVHNSITSSREILVMFCSAVCRDRFSFKYWQDLNRLTCLSITIKCHCFCTTCELKKNKQIIDVYICSASVCVCRLIEIGGRIVQFGRLYPKQTREAKNKMYHSNSFQFKHTALDFHLIYKRYDRLILRKCVKTFLDLCKYFTKNEKKVDPQIWKIITRIEVVKMGNNNCGYFIPMLDFLHTGHQLQRWIWRIKQ